MVQTRPYASDGPKVVGGGIVQVSFELFGITLQGLHILLAAKLFWYAFCSQSLWPRYTSGNEPALLAPNRKSSRCFSSL